MPVIRSCIHLYIRLARPRSFETFLAQDGLARSMQTLEPFEAFEVMVMQLLYIFFHSFFTPAVAWIIE